MMETLKAHVRTYMAQMSTSGLPSRILPRLRPHLADFYTGKKVRRIGHISELLPYTKPYQLVSFDIFDTLVERNIEPPEYVKRRSARFMDIILASAGQEAGVDRIVSARAECEQRLRQAALEQGFDHEAHLDEILFEALRLLTDAEFAEANFQRWVEYELASEAMHLSPKPGAVELLRKLKEQGKTVMLVSDMYLRKGHLSSLLEGMGFAPYVDALFVSSEVRLGKYTKRLFGHALAETGFQASQAIHVGDNFVSDVIRPVQFGMSAVWLHEVGRLRDRKSLAAMAEAATSRKDWSEVLRHLPDVQPNVPVAAADVAVQGLYKIGAESIGPSFAIYVLHTLDEAIRLGVRDIYFLAREGELFYEASKLLLESVPRYQRLDKPRLHYLYVSRVSTILPSIREIGDHQIHVAAFRTWPLSFKAIVKTFGLECEPFAAALAKYKVDPDEVSKEPINDPKLRQIFSSQEFQSTLTKLRDEAASLLRGYLAQHGFFDAGAKMFCDIGWNGTIQFNVGRAFGDDPDFPQLYGHYYGRHQNWLYEFNNPRSRMLEGFALDPNRNCPEEAAINEFVAIFEIAAASTHGSTAGYRRVDGKVEPVLRKAIDVKQSAPRQSLRKGVWDYLREFASSYSRYEFDVDDLRAQARRNLARLLYKPTPAEARAVATLTHDVDWGTDEVLCLVSDKIGWTSVFRPAHYRHEMARSVWKSGATAMLGASLLPFKIARRLFRMLRKALGK